MRIIIDMQACQNESRFRGIGRYTQGIIGSFLKVAQKEHECILLFNAAFTENLSSLIDHYSKYIDRQGIHIWHGIGPNPARNQDTHAKKKISRLLREKYIEKLQPDIVFLSSYFEGYGDDTALSIPKDRTYKIIATAHDLIPFIQQEMYLDPLPSLKDYYLDQISSYKHADGFTAVSESSKQELIQYLNIPIEKINVTLEGIENQFKNSRPDPACIDKILGSIAHNKKIILYFGASDDRKNHLKLIKAYSLLDPEIRRDSILVLAGILNDHHLDKFKAYAARCGLGLSEYVMLKRVSDQEVIDLYSACYLFVFPSFHEGFGLPALEAMACGAPVITSNTTSLPEVIGRSDLTFDPYNAIEIKDLISKFMLDTKFRNKVAEYCLNRAEQFSWDKSARILLSFLENISPNNSKTPHPVDITNIQNECLSKIKSLGLNNDLDENSKKDLSLALIKNFRMPRKSRIYYDISVMITVDFVTGIQRVTTEVFNQIVKDFHHQYEIIPITIEPGSDQLKEARYHSLVDVDKYRNLSSDLNDVRPGDIYLCVDLDHRAPEKSAAYEKLRRNGCKTHFIVHDLLPLDLGDHFFGHGASTAHFNWFKEIAKANALICVSQSVMDHVNYYLNAVDYVNPELELGWFHLGANFKTNAKTLDQQQILKFKNINFNHPVFLIVGSIEPRKGHLELIEAMIDLWDTGLKASLVIVGGRGWNNDLVIDIINTSQYKDKLLFWPQKVSDDDLAYLYSKSTALIAPSLGEGFGLPIIEAMQHGIPVIARDIPVFREVTQGHADFFKTTLELQNILSNYKKQHQTSSLGIKVQSWQESTQQLLNVIRYRNFPIQWERKKALHPYPICSGIFNTTVGTMHPDRISTNNQAGLLIWGGYFPLTAGHYQFKIYGKSYFEQDINLEISIHQDGESRSVYKMNQLKINGPQIIYYDSPELLANLKIDIPENLDRTEIYIHVSNKNNMYVSGFEFIEIESEDQNKDNLGDIPKHTSWKKYFKDFWTA